MCLVLGVARRLCLCMGDDCQTEDDCRDDINSCARKFIGSGAGWISLDEGFVGGYARDYCYSIAFSGSVMNVRMSANIRLPDFIIGGAPKCGTTSLHFILAQHPLVGIPEDEVHFFDADDPIGHPDFLFDGRDGLQWYDPRPDNADALQWYASRFSKLADCSVIGEDSTIYLQSEVAPARIAAMLPDVRLVFMLRDPVRRAYSQYWHLVTRGRATCSFETALKRHPSIIQGSTYAPHLRRYLNLFGPERIFVGLFEDFLSDQEAFVKTLTSFLGLPDMALDANRSWFNRTYYPTYLPIQFAINQISSRIVRGQYRDHFGQRGGLREAIRKKTHYYWFRYAHPVILRSERRPEIKASTEAYLRQHLSARNSGLSDLLQRDLSKCWPGFSS